MIITQNRQTSRCTLLLLILGSDGHTLVRKAGLDSRHDGDRSSFDTIQSALNAAVDFMHNSGLALRVVDPSRLLLTTRPTALMTLRQARIWSASLTG